MSAVAVILGMAAKVGAPIVKSILEKKVGGVTGELAGTVIDAVAKKVGVPPDDLVTAPVGKVEAAVKEVEAQAPEMLAVWQAGLSGQFALLQAETAEGFWQSAWRWGWMYLLGFFWFNALLVFPLMRGAGVQVEPIELPVLVTLTGWFITLYMGGHTAKEIGKQAVEAVKTWRAK